MKCQCVYATSENTGSVRKGYEMGGYVKEFCAACECKHTKPTTRMPRQPTTQFTARLPAELHTWLAERAQKNHRSANAELAAILERLRVMESPIHVCTGCRAPSAYAMSNPDGLCRKCEFSREHGQGN